MPYLINSQRRLAPRRNRLALAIAAIVLPLAAAVQTNAATPAAQNAVKVALQSDTTLTTTTQDNILPAQQSNFAAQPDTDDAMSKPNPLSIGAEAPVFTYRTADGKEHSTANLKGKPFVVYFYPKDNTPGCTTQACGFRDSYADYEKAGLAVIGVSADSEESHGKFRSKHELPFGLSSDPERKVIEAYGVWGPKMFMGNSFLGIHRMSFLVGPDGKIAKVYPKVKVADHAETVLSDARELGLIQ